MAGMSRTPKRPAWFDPNAYAVAEELDAGDWLLNLTLRRWLHDEPSPQVEDALRRAGPVLRRTDTSQIKAMHLADRHRWLATFSSADFGDDLEALFEETNRPSLPSDVRGALRTGAVTSGVKPLRVDEMYLFERRLPDEVRKAGVAFKPGDSAVLHPPAFGGNLDDAFGAGPEHQMTGRFVRLDLTLPDDVLHADLSRYLAAERRRLEAMGGRQPYREAARLKLKAHDLRTLANLHLLEFLDLDRWQRREGLGLRASAVREMADVGRSREAELRRRVDLTLNQMQLHAWFARLDRSENAAPRKRQSSQ